MIGSKVLYFYYVAKKLACMCCFLKRCWTFQIKIKLQAVLDKSEWIWVSFEGMSDSVDVLMNKRSLLVTFHLSSRGSCGSKVNFAVVWQGLSSHLWSFMLIGRGMSELQQFCVLWRVAKEKLSRTPESHGVTKLTVWVTFNLQRVYSALTKFKVDSTTA